MRGYHLPVTDLLHRHSHIVLQLRADVLDSTIRLQASLANMQAWCSLHGTPKADLVAAVDTLKGLYVDALEEIPYLNGGKSSDEIKNSDRDAAIQRYLDMKNSLKKDANDVKPAQPGIKPTVANKRKV